MNLEEGDAAVIDEVSRSMKEDFGEDFAPIVDDIEDVEVQHVEERQTKIPPVFRPFEQEDTITGDDTPNDRRN